MVSVKTYLFDEMAEKNGMVPFAEYSGEIHDIHYVLGVLSISINQNRVFNIETENIDSLWAEIISALLELLDTKTRAVAPIPDWPGELIFEVVHNGKLKVCFSYTDTKVIFDRRATPKSTPVKDIKKCEVTNLFKFVLVMANESKSFFNYLKKIAPENINFYNEQEKRAELLLSRSRGQI